LFSQKEIRNQLFTIKTDDEFNALALQIFHFQYQNNEIYNRYVSALPINARDITHYTQIPCLPISFFKSQEVVCQTIHQDTVCFTSSGTTGQITSKHYVNDVSIYEFSFNKGFELFYGKPSDYCILALLPNYLEREGSSLVYMFDHLITQSKQPDSGFYLNNINELVAKIEELKQRNQKTLLLGVTYALLDLADLNTELSDDVIVMETGGMKGKRPEMLKEELHTILKEKFKVNAIHSEYGMTELLSQAYSKKDGLFACPPWMRVLVRDVNDPFSYSFNKKTGGINVIDLANINSCSFIETKDLGKIHDNNQFEIIGRFDNSDIRGCNLMIQ
jgi:phenylacetate-coenzyme A ligase PaaK-like adenylate-forming protein